MKRGTRHALARYLGLVFMLLIVAGCNGDDGGPLFELNGTYEGPITGAPGRTGSLRLNLTQSGNAVSGPAFLSVSGFGTASGSFSGNLDGDQLVGAINGCTLRGTVSDFGLQIDGTIDCGGGVVVGFKIRRV